MLRISLYTTILPDCQDTPLVLQSRAKAQCVVAENFPLGAFAEAGAVDGLRHRFRPGAVAVRPVGGEQPHILAQFLDAEFDGALPAVDAVEIAALGQNLARHP